MIQIIGDIKEASKKCVVIVGSEMCVACKQISKAIEKEPTIEAYYIDIQNAYNYLNTLKQKTRSLPVIIFLKNNEPVNVLTGNVSINKIREEYNKNA